MFLMSVDTLCYSHSLYLIECFTLPVDKLCALFACLIPKRAGIAFGPIASVIVQVQRTFLEAWRSKNSYLLALISKSLLKWPLFQSIVTILQGCYLPLTFASFWFLYYHYQLHHLFILFLFYSLFSSWNYKKYEALIIFLY